MEPLQEVTINNLFARSVIEQKVAGTVYVDDCNNPETFYVVHPYGMTLLFGNSTHEVFNQRFKEHALNTAQTRNRHEWMQAFPNTWDAVLNNLFSGSLVSSTDNVAKQEKGLIELNTRVNFRFNANKYTGLRTTNNDPDLTIVRTDSRIFREMQGSVVPMHFWNSEADFLNTGAGFSLLYRDALASTAYSSFIHENKFELGIETIPQFRGKGYAEYVCTALIDYCIKNDYEPVWACRLENTGSYKLALKLGFEPVVEIPYYRLSK